MRSAPDYEETIPSENEEARLRIPYVGELWQSLMDCYDYYETEPLIWSVTRLDWYEEVDPETDELLAEDLFVHFEDVLDPACTLVLNFVDLDLELERFPC